MSYLEIHKSIAEITREKCDECKAKLDAVPRENVTERKALQLEKAARQTCHPWIRSIMHIMQIHTRLRIMKTAHTGQTKHGTTSDS